MTDDPITTEEYFRGALKVIAHWSEVDLSGEWETGLRGVIRSITDMAREVLSAHPGAAKAEPATVAADLDGGDARPNRRLDSSDRGHLLGVAQAAGDNIVDQLRDAFEKYARHDDDCTTQPWHGKGPLECSCGLYQLQGALEAALAAQPPAAPVDIEPRLSTSSGTVVYDHGEAMAPAAPVEMGVLDRLIRVANLLFQNSVACAAQHHGLDIELNGLPGWLADCKKVLNEANEIPPTNSSAETSGQEG